MAQLEKLKLLIGNPIVSSELLNIYLDNASGIITELRNTDIVENKYLNLQLKIAVEMFNKRGAEGQTGHNENGINRSYETSDVSFSLLSQITPATRTPFSVTKVVTL